ncbi:MAG: hypothetical protein Q9Q40_13750 [Acidobacteriota bacterium]|nr:hypothetical protein [Acidobacteriota bacterium]
MFLRRGWPRGERGSALLAVLVVSLLLSATAVGLWLMVQGASRGAARRGRQALARRAATSVLVIAARWFEWEERSGLVAPPAVEEVDRGRRQVDPDGDDRGTPWSLAPPPWNVRYREGGGALLRPPDGPDPVDRLVGTAGGPDVELREDDPAATGKLAAIEAIIAPGGGLRLVRLAIFGPPAWAGKEGLARVEVEVRAEAPADVGVRVRARGLVRHVDWGRPDRPLLVRGDASWGSGAPFRGGEAVVGGDLRVAAGSWARWPSGVPWAGVDAPLRRDNDGDGSADDRDGDGRGDFEQWLTLADPVADPWFRLRIGGGWNGPAASGPCATPFPFAPWRTPPVAPRRDDEHSGVWLECPAAGLEPVPVSWRRLVRRGVQGVQRWVQEAAGTFRLDAVGPSKSLGDILPRGGGVVLLELEDGAAPLEIVAEGLEGAVLLVGDRGVRLRGATTRGKELRVDPQVGDSAGEDRRAGPGDPFLDLTPDGLSCLGWHPGDWRSPTAPRPPRRDCGRRGLHLDGLLATEGLLELAGAWEGEGALRAASLEVDESLGPATVRPAACPPSGRRRCGPPGAPRVLLSDVVWGW